MIKTINIPDSIPYYQKRIDVMNKKKLLHKVLYKSICLIIHEEYFKHTRFSLILCNQELIWIYSGFLKDL
jgi:hypothetical protein